jgi:hypothetical protein
MYKKHSLSLAYLTVFGCPPVDNVKVAASCGYDMVSLRLIAPHGLNLVHPIVGNKALIQGRRRRYRRLLLRWGSVYTFAEDRYRVLASGHRDSR